jgi:hypothetical protein
MTKINFLKKDEYGAKYQRLEIQNYFTAFCFKPNKVML